MYKADDGEAFNTEAEALRRDELLKFVKWAGEEFSSASSITDGFVLRDVFEYFRPAP